MRWLRVVVSLFVLSCASLQAQRVLFGVKGGLTALNGFNGRPTHTETRIYTLGPTVEIKLSGPLAIEADVLYHRMGYSKSVEAYGLRYITRMRANAWDFPILLKYSVSMCTLRPYVAAGWVFRTFSGIAGTYQTFGLHPADHTIVVNTTTPVEARYLIEKYPAGPTAGAVLQFKTGRLRIGPEVRYTRWLRRAVDEQGSQYNSGGFHPLFSSQNQIDFLLGLTF
jgi:hypothetical protein